MDEKLRAMMERYLASLIKNDPSALPVAARLRVSENGYPINLGRGLFETATAVTYRHVICDPQAGHVAVFSAAKEAILLNNVLIRLKVAEDKISEIEALMTNIPLGASSGWPDDTARK